MDIFSVNQSLPTLISIKVPLNGRSIGGIVSLSINIFASRAFHYSNPSRDPSYYLNRLQVTQTLYLDGITQTDTLRIQSMGSLECTD
jgi:hypothetical protein